MPELPEVETIKEDLRELVVGSTIRGVEVKQPALVERPAVEEFVRLLSGARISEVRRRGKNLVVGLDSGDSLVLQLKIGGQFLLVPPVEEPTTALMLVLRLEDGRALFLRDETGFTRGALLDGEELEARFSKLGPDPLGEGFGPGYLAEKVGSRRAQVKPLILDQAIVAGVGNIYADESLFDARIHPRRKASTLDADEWEGLRAAIVANLAAGIEHRGTTFSLYRDVLGRRGHHQDHLRVFLRQGKPCPAGCGGKVVKERVGGRATFLCPQCQPEDGSGGEAGLKLG